MRIVIIPRFVELYIMINPIGEVNRGVASSAIVPWMYAPWPDARRTGIVEIEVKGETLRPLLTELAHRYEQTDFDFTPIDPRTRDVDADYAVLINDQNY